MTKKRYSELKQLKTFQERFEYANLAGQVGTETFGSMRFINQWFYRSSKWRKVRNEVIIRDNGCDLGVDGMDILDKVIVHHLNPITEEDIDQDRPCLYDLENLICVSHSTHNAIHYGDQALLPKLPQERKPFDTCPWRQTQQGR